MFAGIDPSLTGTAIIILDDKYKIIDKQEFRLKFMGIERLYHLENLFLEFIEKHEKLIKFICMEAPSYGSHEGQLHSIGKWAGIIELNLFKKGLSPIFPVPLQVKKYCTGSGKGDKNIILLKTFKNFGEEFESDDSADAYIIARIAHDYYYKYVRADETKLKDIKKHQLEVLKKLHESLCENSKDLI